MQIEMAIPVVDISRFVQQNSDTEGRRQVGINNEIDDVDDDEENQVVASQWDEAFREHGFVVIIGHGVPSELVTALESAMDTFFTGLSHDEKMLYNNGSYGTPLGGYSPLFTEAVAQSSSGIDGGGGGSDGVRSGIDAVESFAFTIHPLLFKARQMLSSSAPSSSSSSTVAASRLMDCAAAYYTAVEQLLYLLHRISAYALGLPHVNYINDHYQFNFTAGERQGEGISSGNALKLSHYPHVTPPSSQLSTSTSPLSGGEDKRDKVARYGAHTDFQGFTILRPDPRDWAADGAGGLEVLHAGTGTWLPVVLPSASEIRSRLRPRDNGEGPGPASGDFALVVNAGDLIQRWTNDRWVSAVHRVSPRTHTHTDTSTLSSTSVPVLREAPSASASAAGRTAVVFFSGPRDDALVAVLPMRRRGQGADKDEKDKEEDTVAAKYEPIRSGDHLLLKLRQMQPASHPAVPSVG